MRVGRGGEKGIVCCNECLLNGQCDWRSNIFILGMIFLTQKKKKKKKGTLQSARSENWVLAFQLSMLVRISNVFINFILII